MNNPEYTYRSTLVATRPVNQEVLENWREKVLREADDVIFFDISGSTKDGAGIEFHAQGYRKHD